MTKDHNSSQGGDITSEEDEVGKQPVLSRRNIIKSSIVGVPLIPTTRKGDDDYISVPLVENGDEILHSTKVHRRWWDYVEKAERVQENVNSEWLQKPGVKDVNLVRSDRQINGRSVTKINVEVQPNEFEGGIPKEVDGIEVQISEWEEPTLVGHLGVCQSDLEGDHDSMPGGCVNEYPKSSNAYKVGTACCRIWDGNSYEFLTVHHLAAPNNCGDSALNNQITQHTRNVGTVSVEIGREDVILYSDNSSTISFSDEVETKNHGRIPIHGAATNYSYMMTNDTPMEAAGISTGYHTNEEITNYNVGGGCYDFAGYGVRTSCNAAQGDSGSPVYWIWEGNDGKVASLVHMTSKQKGSSVGTNCNGATITSKREGVSSDRLMDHGWKIGTK